MRTLGTYDTDVSDVYAVHRSLLGALDAAAEGVAIAAYDSARLEPAFNACVADVRR